jgi:Ca-activated chloride channel family protein
MKNGQQPGVSEQGQGEMKKALVWIPILLLAALALAGCSQSAEKLNNDGNEAFANQDYQSALTAYHQAQEEAPELAEPHYNEANTHYRLEDYGQAQQQIEQALVTEEGQEALDQSSYYNLGNVFFQAEQYEMAIEAYKEALRLNPDDLQAKQNLELALRQLQQQQQQQQDEQNQDQQQDQQNQDQQNQDKQDQDQQNQDQQNQDQQTQEQQGEQGQNQEQQEQQGEQGQNQEQQEQQQGQQMSKEDAERLLDAIEDAEEELQAELRSAKAGKREKVDKDW